MAQSGPAYEVEQPKGNANTQNHRSTEPPATTQPACSAAERTETEWRAPPFVETLSGFYEPCQRPECFGDGVPDPATVERVIISRNSPSVFHRVRRDQTQRGQAETTDDRLFTNPVPETGEPVGTLADLYVGDGVVWNPPQVPLTVVGTAAIELRGPSGGEYTLARAERPDAKYVVHDGYGCISGISRVAPVRDRSHPEEI